MKFEKICFITDTRSSSLSLQEMVHCVLRAGIKCIQYREKDLPRRQIYENSIALRELTRAFNAMLIINDHADIALAADADGVHLGQEDLPLKEARKIMKGKIIGISTHDLRQARDAERDGADYIGFGPVFQTVTKDAGLPKGLENVRTIKQSVGIPVVAIGGINPDNVGSVLDAGADCVAVASAICREDIKDNAERFVNLINTRSGK